MPRLLLPGLAAIAVFCVAATVAEAQSTPCPVVSAAVVGAAVGSPVADVTQPTGIAGLDLCSFNDAARTNFGVSRDFGVYAPGEGGAAALAARYIPQLSDDMRAQIGALSQVGINIEVPGYPITIVSGVGDAALLVKTELIPGFFKDSLLVQQGGNAFSFDTDDSPSAADQLNALALAVLANQTP
jgi:hypothetical protein